MKVLSLQSNSFLTTTRTQANPTFGIANCGKLKTLFTYPLPCMYSGVDMIDPKKVQRLISKKAFDAPLKEVLKILAPFEKSITGAEAEVYQILKEKENTYAEKDLQSVLKSIAPYYNAQLKSIQIPILDQMLTLSQSLDEEKRYKFVQLIEENKDKINEKPVFVPFSAEEFKYKLEKIHTDINQNGTPKAGRVMDKLLLESENIENMPEEKQKEVMRFLKIILKSSMLKNNPQLKSLISESQKRLNRQNSIIPFLRKTFIYDMNNIINDLPDETVKAKFAELASYLPSSSDNPAAYILKFSREASWKIAYRLLWANLASVEHILPQSKGGKDEMSNFGGAGARENALRGHIDFTEQLIRRPKTSENSQKYVDGLINLVKKGVFNKIHQNTGYIDDFCSTIYRESNGAVVLDTSELQIHREKGKKLLSILAGLLNNK